MNSHSYRVLVVDDSRTIRQFVKECFEGEPSKLTFAENGKIACEKIRSLPDPGDRYDLILLDWEMPEMTGPELLDQLNQWGNDTPVIMMTTKNEYSDIEAMLKKGAREYMMKPFSKEILFEKIERTLKG
ncbi:MAG: response regulator [Bdellovibrionales bacterium]|nr:response regulator [Bdellovibrionales bacterium]